MKRLKTFEDLQCWQLGVEVCDEVYDLCEKANIPTDDELSCRWYIASLNISGKIAYAFGPEDTEWLEENLPLAKKYCMETVFWAGIALHKQIISKTAHKKLVTKIKRIIKKIDAILRYLEKYGSQEKYKWKVLFGENKSE